MITNKIPILGVLALNFCFYAPANAGTIVPCGKATCSSAFTIKADGKNIGGGEFLYDAKTGDIALSKEKIIGSGVANDFGGITWSLDNGEKVMVNSISGNADPVLFFNLGAETTSSASNYSFIFDLPIALSDPIETKSSVSYSLTSKTSAGAQIQGLGGNKVVQSWDIDTSVGGLGSLNKNVDVGDTHFHLGGPSTSSSPVYTDTDSIIGDLAYDQMGIEVSFNLSADSIVSMTGFVQQTPVPVPAAGWLMITGIGFLTARKKFSLV